MSRRKSEFDHLFSGILVLLRDLPWWVGPPVIALTWAGIAYLLPVLLKVVAGMGDQPFLRTLCETLAEMSPRVAVMVAALVAMIWGVALLQKLGGARRLDGQTSLESIRALPWREFEQLLADAFRRQGYRVRETPSGADGGVDLILDKGRCRTLVQAKQWKRAKVGVKVVRELLGVKTAEGADAAILAASGTVTAEATRFARSNGITIIAGSELAQMIQDVQRGRRIEQTVAANADRTEAAMATPAATTDSARLCPDCGAAMVRRIARRGKNAGAAFWGCSTYPACRAIAPMAQPNPEP